MDTDGGRGNGSDLMARRRRSCIVDAVGAKLGMGPRNDQ